MQVNKFIDHTLLKAFATSADIKKLCDEAIKYETKIVVRAFVLIRLMFNKQLTY